MFKTEHRHQKWRKQSNGSVCLGKNACSYVAEAEDRAAGGKKRTIFLILSSENQKMVMTGSSGNHWELRQKVQTSDPGRKVVTLAAETNLQSYCLPGGDLIRRGRILSQGLSLQVNLPILIIPFCICWLHSHREALGRDSNVDISLVLWARWNYQHED